VENLLGALTIASHYNIPEVALFFNQKLFRGNRVSKVDAYDFNAFESPNLKPLVTLGVNIGTSFYSLAFTRDVAWDIILERPLGVFSVQKEMNPNVACIRLFPGITDATIKMFLAPPIQGVILETYYSDV
jgi:60kDa lysophospholipase